MSNKLKLLILILLLATVGTNARSQTIWPSPEVEQMYNQAREYLSSGNLKQAIVTYQQAIRLAPDHLVLYRDLGKAYYLTGDYKDAESTLEPLLKSEEADALSFQVMAACQKAAGETKKSKSTLLKGLDRFPNSGILYHDLGMIYQEDNEMVYALQTWLDGIHKDPTYHVNYYEAARTYMNTDKVVWAILYGEIFVNIERQTPRSYEMRGMLLKAYQKLFSSFITKEVPKFGSDKKNEQPQTFEDAVYTTFLNLSPVVSDGITTENLTMLRTRFIMAWSGTYMARYPFSLFSYQDKMLRDGYFDIYNEWLFGKVENDMAFTAWNKFHKDAILKYENWAKQNPLKPEVTDFYNTLKVDGIFDKKK